MGASGLPVTHPSRRGGDPNLYFCAASGGDFGSLSSASDAFARLRAVVDWVIGGSLIALLFAFQPELRQGLMKLDPARWFGSSRASGSTLAIEAIIQAAKQASPIRQGMIVAFERKASLEPLVESGIRLDACVSTPLLMSDFHKESPLHARHCRAS